MPRTARSIRETDVLTGAVPRPIAASPAARILSTIKAFMTHMLVKRRMHHDWRQLMAMNDHELSDMGVSRGHIEDVVHHGRHAPRAEREGL